MELGSRTCLHTRFSTVLFSHAMERLWGRHCLPGRNILTTAGWIASNVIQIIMILNWKLCHVSLTLTLWCTDFSASITTMSTFLLVSKMSQPIGWRYVKKKKALVKFPSSPKYIFLPLVPEYLSFTVWNDVCRVWHQRAVSTFIAETVNFVWAHWKPDLKRRAYELDLWHRKIIWMDPGPICKLYNCDVET